MKAKLAEIITDVDSKIKIHDMKGVKMKIIIGRDKLLIFIPPLHINLDFVNRYFIKPEGNS